MQTVLSKYCVIFLNFRTYSIAQQIKTTTVECSRSQTADSLLKSELCILRFQCHHILTQFEDAVVFLSKELQTRYFQVEGYES